MGEVLVFTETRFKGEGKEIHPVTYELLGKGKELAGDLNDSLAAVLFSGGGVDPQELIYRGADKVFFQEDERFGVPDEILFRRGLKTLVEKEKPDIFLVGATNFGRSLAPRLAMALDTGLTADCTGLEIDDDGSLVQIRPAFSGNILAHISTKTTPQMSTVRYKEMEEAERDESRKGQIVETDFDLGDPDTGSQVLEEEFSGDVDLPEAQVIVAGGRGLREQSDLETLEELADLLGGKLGSSRPLVDEGWIGRDHQVGYSGNRVQPTIYIACGISGQSQHLAGMKESDTIIAINSDPSAPIFEVADFGIVGDLYEVVPAMIERLKTK